MIGRAFRPGHMESALELFTQDAETQDPYALEILGNMCYYGCGVEQDEARTVELLEQAIVLGSEDAVSVLEHINEE